MPPRPTLEDIFNEPDEFGLLNVRLNARAGQSSDDDKNVDIVRQVNTFYENNHRLPDGNAIEHDEMRLGIIWEKVSANPTNAMRAADTHGLLQGFDLKPSPRTSSWRDDGPEDEIPASLDDIFSDDELDITVDYLTIRNVTPAAMRNVPDHRAENRPCTDFADFAERFSAMQAALDSGERTATIVEDRAIIEPLEGDFFIRNGLLAYIAEKTEMSSRGGSRDHRLRIIFSNGTESDPLMSSFRKSLNEDKTARVIQREGLGPLDKKWQSDSPDISGTIYVARSLSTDPAIVEVSNILHKIGVTSQDIKRRLADARNDPTFLMAPVELVATYELKNLARSKVEELLHRFFEGARPADLFVTDRFGKKIRPREWFYVLPEHVSQAAKLIQNGTLHECRYDVRSQKIVKNNV
ncbi:GIY-YIG nuclease family protein [Ochrobactrum sp. MH181795]|nr:GIY-YIG nuclease family protein [Ochrobactrum sp. XJ1]RNL45643.1 GIY-YIG nuclease family protein [Ochrobactrum sp. MH181795]